MYVESSLTSFAAGVVCVFLLWLLRPRYKKYFNRLSDPVDIAEAGM